MPQMSPLMWMLMMPITNILMLLYIIFIFFLNLKYNFKKNKMENLILLKWMW